MRIVTQAVASFISLLLMKIRNDCRRVQCCLPYNYDEEDDYSEDEDSTQYSGIVSQGTRIQQRTQMKLFKNTDNFLSQSHSEKAKNEPLTSTEAEWNTCDDGTKDNGDPFGIQADEGGDDFFAFPETAGTNIKMQSNDPIFDTPETSVQAPQAAQFRQASSHSLSYSPSPVSKVRLETLHVMTGFH